MSRSTSTSSVNAQSSSITFLINYATGQISAEGMNLRGLRSNHPDLPAHSTVAMIAGMAALRSTIFGPKPPPRAVIVDELIQAILHGFLHRQG